MKLTIIERLKLLDLLPREGNRLNLKIMRKLRESLSFSEEELKSFSSCNEYMCPYRDEGEDGKMISCDNKGFFAEQPTCGKHDLLMQPTGQVTLQIPPEVLTIEKEIHMGSEAIAIAETPLRNLNSTNKLTEDLESLYDKFFPPREDD